MNAVMLNVGDKQVLSTDVTYNDLVILYTQYYHRNGRLPLTSECKSANNLPQMRIIQRVIAESGYTYKQFCGMFGKTGHVRADAGDISFKKYVDGLVHICKEQGTTIRCHMLTQFGLPSAKWFIKHCPDPDVLTYSDFITWCGLTPPKHIFTKGEVANGLKELERKLGRPIRRDDICVKTVGFSPIVINRLFGSLTQAKNELGLMSTPTSNGMGFAACKHSLDSILNNFLTVSSTPYITWKDIESGKYGNSFTHKTYCKIFNDEGIDIHQYMKSFGVMMNQSDECYTYTFSDGERVQSGLEYKTTKYLRSLGMVYNVDYKRAVKYRTFTNVDSRIDCDYVIQTNDHPLFVEVMGYISSCGGNWRECEITDSRVSEYRRKAIHKESVLEEAGVDYLFLFLDDFEDSQFKQKISERLAA